MTEGHPASSSAGGYRPEIDGLRAVAILAVLVNHFHAPLMPNGHLGVDIFFVVSGFVITASLHAARGERLGRFLLAFYARRVKRLIPALLLCIVPTAVAICLFNPAPSVALKTGIASLFGFSNIYLLKASADYFATASELNPFTHTWSLGVEEQFYLTFPLLFWLTLRRSGTPFRIVLGGLSLLSLAAFLYLSRTNAPSAFYLAPARLWELGTGCLLFVFLHGLGAARRVPRYTAAAVFALLIVALFLPFRFTLAATIAVVALTAALIALLRPDTAVYRILAHRWVVFVGLISYSLYLWHWSVLSLSRWTIGIHWWSVPFQLALMFGLAIASYRYVELPLRRRSWSSAQWKTIAWGLASSMAGAAVLIALLRPLNGRLYAGNPEPLRTGAASRVLAGEGELVRRVDELQITCNLTPHHRSGSDWRPRPVTDAAFMQRCLGSAPGSRKVLLIGDSFAQISSPWIAIMAQRMGYEFRLLSGYGCPYPLPFDQLRAPIYERCGEIDERYLWQQVIGSLRPGDLVVLRLDLVGPQYLNFRYGNRPPVDAWDRALSAFAGAVSGRGARLLVIGGNPIVTLEQSLARPQWFNFGNAFVDARPFDNAETETFYRMEDHLRTSLAGRGDVAYFSVTPYLCDPSLVCRLTDGGRSLFTDRRHISPHAYDLFFDDLFRQLSTLAR